MTGGKVLPAIQVDLIGRTLRNNVPAQYASVQNHNRLLILNNRTRLTSSARKCLFGPSDPQETKKLYNECVEQGRQRFINNYDFDIFADRVCDNSSMETIAATTEDTTASSTTTNSIFSTMSSGSDLCETSEKSVQSICGKVNVNDAMGENFERLRGDKEAIVRESSQSSIQMCNSKCDDFDMKLRRNLKRSYPYTKITDYFPKTKKMASTKNT